MIKSVTYFLGHPVKKKQTPDDIKLCKKFRNRVSNELKESKAKYFHNHFSVNSQNMKKICSGIKTIISHKSSTSSSISKIKGKDGNLKAVCHAFDWVIVTIQRIGNLNG